MGRTDSHSRQSQVRAANGPPPGTTGPLDRLIRFMQTRTSRIRSSVYSATVTLVDGVPVASTPHSINIDGQDSHDLSIPVEELFSAESLISGHSFTVNEIPTDDRYDWFATLLLLVLVLGVVELWVYRNRVPLDPHVGGQR